MARARRESIRAVIDNLNSIQVGELSAIQAKLIAAAADLREIEEGDLGGVVDDARGLLDRGDVGEFRRLVAQAVARLGHIK